MEEDHRFLELEDEAISTYELQRGDLLACRFNGNLHYVGRVAVYEKYSGHRQVYPDKLIRFRLHQSLINPWYIRLAMNCQGIRSVVESMCATTAGNIGISATNLKTVTIPIPPFEEQYRIVAKVNALMAVCDALEARLAATRKAQAAFAAAAVHHLDV
jgi:type I restriction enzyme S subunit